MSLFEKVYKHFGSTLSRRNIFVVLYLSKEQQKAMCLFALLQAKNNAATVPINAVACDFAYFPLILLYFTLKCAEIMKRTNFRLVDKSSFFYGGGSPKRASSPWGVWESLSPAGSVRVGSSCHRQEFNTDPFDSLHLSKKI